jgi:parallel beta-helix repeat protein
MSNRIRIFTLIALLGLVLVLTPHTQQAEARTTTVIQVNPGIAHAIRKALKSANPGDTLNVHTGTYNEALNITKNNITLQSAGDGTVILDAGCGSEAAIQMNADGIIIKGLTVRGGIEYTISAVGRNSGTVRSNKVISTCSGAEYGVNVYGRGSLRVIENEGSGFADAVIYIGGIAATPAGALKVKGNNTYNSQRGIIIEDSSGVNIKVLQNNVHDILDTGILIHNSDEILIRGNTMTNDTNNGIHLDAPSDTNSVINNVISGNTNDINNEGTGNCFTNNTYTTVSGDVSTPCS